MSQSNISVEITASDDIKTSLSSQGYAIYKSKISPLELKTIQDDLSITPYVCPGYGSEEDITPYKIYKENIEKIYVPSLFKTIKSDNSNSNSHHKNK